LVQGFKKVDVIVLNLVGDPEEYNIIKETPSRFTGEITSYLPFL